MPSRSPIAVTVVMLMTVLLTAGLVGEAAAQYTEADVTGRVTDPDGEGLPGVTVTATHLSTGTTRVTTTLADGTYNLRSLRTGLYDFKAELSGFSTVVRSEITLSVGQGVELNFELTLATVQETITVVGEQPLIDTKRSDLGGIIDEQQIERLPINGRNWMELSLLAPGTQQDEGKPTAGTGKTEMSRVYLDGQEADNQCCPGVMNMGISQDSLEEFIVLTNRFDASLGKSGSVVVQAQSKGGTNDWHGGGVYFFRDDALNAADFFTGRVEPFRNTQVGFFAGGPIAVNKSHIFGSFERHDEPSTISANTGIPAFDVSQDAKTNRKFALFRWDHQINPNNRIHVRASILDEILENFRLGGRTPIQGSGDRPWNNEAYTVGWTSVLSDRAINDLKVNVLSNQFANEGFVVFPNLNFPSVQIGSPTNEPSRITDTVVHVRDDFSYYVPTSWGDHDMKWGGEIDHTQEGGIFGILGRGAFTFDRDPPNIDTCCLSLNPDEWDTSQFPAPLNFTIGLGDFNVDVSQTIYSGYFQDDWTITPRLTLNLGVRYDLDSGSLGEDVRTDFIQPRQRDTDNIQPRLGFAYDLTGSGNTILRGGFGIYYDQVFLNITFDQQIFNGETYVVAFTSNDDGRPDFFENPLGGLTFEDFLTGGAPTDIQPLSPDMQLPRNETYSLGIAHQIGRKLAIEADFVHIKGVNHLNRIERNVFCCTDDGFPLPVAEFGRPFPQFNQIQEFNSSAKSLYDGLQVGVKKRFENGYQFGITYLLSRAKDSADGAFSFPNNPFDLADEYTRSQTDQRHRFVANWLTQLPYDIWVNGIFFAASGRAQRVSVNRDVNGDVIFRGDRPFCDSSIPGCSVLGIPDGQLIPRNPWRAEPVYRLDLRVSKRIAVTESLDIEPIWEVFNVFNRENFDPDRYVTNVFSSRFGTPSRSGVLQYQPRQMQVAVRVTF